MRRSESNLAVVAEWVARTPWVDFLASDPATRSCTSICLKITDPAFQSRTKQGQTHFIKTMIGRLERENVAHDIGSYRDAPPGLRVWGGATIELSDIRALLPWLEWAYATTSMECS